MMVELDIFICNICHRIQTYNCAGRSPHGDCCRHTQNDWTKIS